MYYFNYNGKIMIVRLNNDKFDIIRIYDMENIITGLILIIIVHFQNRIQPSLFKIIKFIFLLYMEGFNIEGKIEKKQYDIVKRKIF